MASTGSLKRRLPGHASQSSGVTDTGDSSPGPAVSDSQPGEVAP